MSFSDLLALTNQLSRPEPEPAPFPLPDFKEELDGLKVSLEELKLVQKAQGVQVHCTHGFRSDPGGKPDWFRRG